MTPHLALSRWTAVRFVLIVVLGATLALLGQPRSDASEKAAPASGTFLLRNVATKKCIDVPGTGEAYADAPVRQWSCRYTPTADNMRWVLTRLPRNTPKGYGRYLIRHEYDNKCLDLPGFGSAKKTTPVTTYPCAEDSDADNQVFYLTKAKGGWMFHHAKSKNLCLDVAGRKSKEDGKPLTLYTCSTHDDHIWALTKSYTTLKGQAISVKNQSVLGAFSQTIYTMDENDYKFQVFLSDPIRDHHNCAYVEFRLMHLIGFGDAAGLWFKDSPVRRTICDTDVVKTVRLDPNKIIPPGDNMLSARTKVLVKTCENIDDGRDRCSDEYDTASHDY